jgi:hypothetical protein
MQRFGSRSPGPRLWLLASVAVVVVASGLVAAVDAPLSAGGTTSSAQQPATAHASAGAAAQAALASDGGSPASLNATQGPVLTSVWPRVLLPWAEGTSYRTLLLNGTGLQEVVAVDLGSMVVPCPSSSCTATPSQLVVAAPSNLPSGFLNVTAMTANGTRLLGHPCYPDTCVPSTTIGVAPAPHSAAGSADPEACVPISPGTLGVSGGLEADLEGDNYAGSLEFDGGLTLTPTLAICLTTGGFLDTSPIWLNFTESLTETASASLDAIGSFSYSNLEDPTTLLGPSLDGVFCASFLCLTLTTSVILEIQASLSASLTLNLDQGTTVSISQDYSFQVGQWYESNSTACLTGTASSGCATFSGSASVAGSLMVRVGPEIDLDAYGVAGLTIFPFAEFNLTGGYSTSGGLSDDSCGGQALGFPAGAPPAPWVVACVSAGIEVGVNVLGDVLADQVWTFFGVPIAASVMICDPTQCGSTLDVQAGNSVTLSAYSAVGGVTFSWTSPCLTSTETGSTLAFEAPGTVGDSCTLTVGNGLPLAISQIDLSDTEATVVATTPTTYAVQFIETGLAGGTLWTVSVGGVMQQTESGSLTFWEPSGPFSYTVGSVTGYSVMPMSGSGTVSGASPTPIEVTFTPLPSSVTVTFDESGLPSGTPWSVTFGDQSPTPVLGLTTTFTVAPSIYSYTIGSVSGYTATPSGGTVDVMTAGTTVDVVFSQVTSLYTVEFTETGLPGGTSWSVTLGGASQTESSSSMTFSEPTGSYAYAVESLDYHANPAEGTVSVSGSSPPPIAVVFRSGTVYSEWTELSTSGPSARYAAAMTWDSRDNELVLFGGCSNLACSSFLGDTWVYSGGSWSEISSTHSPSARAGAMMSFDTRDNYVLLFGGYGSSGYLNDTWIFEGNQWTQLDFGGIACGGPSQPGCPDELVPPARDLGEMTFDVGDNYVFLFSGDGPGGDAPGGISDPSPYADYWDFAGGQWNFISEISLFNAEHNGVFPIYGGSATYDSAAGLVVIYGGYEDELSYGTSGDNGQALGYSGGSWSQLDSGEDYDATTMVYDPVSEYAVAFGGCTSGGTPSAVTGLFVQNGWNYPPLSPTPAARCGASSAWDPSIYRIVVFGGEESSGLLSDTWAYVGSLGISSFSGTPGTISVGGSVSFSAVVTGGTPPYTYTYHGLPPGCSPSSSQSQFTCSFSTAGTFSIVLNVTDSSSPAQFYSSSATVQVNPPPVYSVTFEEMGLAPGLSWGASIDARVAQTTSTSSTSISESNGSYGFDIIGPSNYSAQPASGSFAVNGGPDTITITFSPINYTAVFAETGLPSGTAWEVTLAGNSQSLTANGSLDQIAFWHLTNGTYAYSVTPVVGWEEVSAPASGELVIHGSNATIVLEYRQSTYTVAFQESGLPAGLLWAVTVGGVPLNLITTEFNGTLTWFSEFPNGSYPYSIAAVPGWILHPGPASGTASIAGDSLEINVSYTPAEYEVTFTTDPTTCGSITFNGTTYTHGESVQVGAGAYSVSATTCSGYSLESLTGSGDVSVSSGTATVSGAGGVTATFTPVSVTKYTVTFTETGLPAKGKEWSVSIDGTTQTATATAKTATVTSISFMVPVGSQPYVIVGPAGFQVTGTTPAGGPVGTLSVTGTTTVAVTFAKGATPAVTFHEVGLAKGSTWCVTLGSTLKGCSTTASVVFKGFTPATYSYALETIGSATTLVKVGTTWTVQSSGSVTNTKGVTVQVRYAYTVTFTETGLAGGTSWTVTSQGQTVSSTTDTILIYLTNGTQSFSVHAVTGYTRSPASGHLDMAGAPASQAVTFTPRTPEPVTAPSGPVATVLHREAVRGVDAAPFLVLVIFSFLGAAMALGGRWSRASR